MNSNDRCIIVNIDKTVISREVILNNSIRFPIAHLVNILDSETSQHYGLSSHINHASNLITIIALNILKYRITNEDLYRSI